MLSASEELYANESGILPDGAFRPVSIKLTKPQLAVAVSNARFRINVAGRRSGKTYTSKVLLFASANNNKRTRNWYVAPTYRMAKQIMWQEMKDLVMNSGRAGGLPNETDLSITLKNGSIISLRGADNPDSLRGVGIDFLVLDEVQDINKETWEAVLAPALADRNGKALLQGTPKGYNWFYDLWNDAHDDKDWSTHKSTTLAAGIVPQEEINRYKRTMDERLFRQEFEASFETLAGRVYQQFNRDVNVTSELNDNGGDLLIGMDFNVNPMCACVAIRAGNQLHVIDEVVLADANTEIMAQAINNRFNNRQITIYPDPSGRARRTSAPVGQTDFTILENYGYTVVAPRQAPLVIDRINEVNALIQTANGEINLYIHPRCSQTIKSLEGLTFKDGTNMPDKSTGLDHMADALGYLIHSEFPLNADVVGVGRLRGYY